MAYVFVEPLRVPAEGSLTGHLAYSDSACGVVR